MSYIKLGTQKQKLDKTTSACQLSKKALETKLKNSSGKTKDLILVELAKRASLVAKQRKKSQKMNKK